MQGWEERERKRKGRSEEEDPWGTGKKRKAGNEVTEEELGEWLGLLSFFMLKLTIILQRPTE